MNVLESSDGHRLMAEQPPVTVTVQFPDGARKRVNVTKGDAESLSRAGDDLSTWRRRSFFAAAKWICIAVATAVVLPALPKQWGDRQSGLALKGDLTNRISTGSVVAFQNGQRIAAMRQPSQSATQARKEAINQWASVASDIDPTIAVYFHDHPIEPGSIEQEWLAYKRRMRQYLELSCCDHQRTQDVEDEQNYIGDGPYEDLRVEDPWTILNKGNVNPDYRQVYSWLGRELLDQRGKLLQTLAESDAEGYSHGLVGFLNDVLPGEPFSESKFFD